MTFIWNVATRNNSFFSKSSFMFFSNKSLLFFNSIILLVAVTLYIAQEALADVKLSLIYLFMVSYVGLEFYFLQKAEKLGIVQTLILTAPILLAAASMVGFLSKENIGGSLFFTVFSIFLAKETASKDSHFLLKLLLISFMVFALVSMQSAWAFEHLIIVYSSSVAIYVIAKKTYQVLFLKKDMSIDTFIGL